MKKLIGIITLFSFLFTLPVLAQHPASCASYVTFKNTGCQAIGIYTYDNRGRQKYIHSIRPGKQWRTTTVTNQKWTFLAGSGKFKQNWYSKECRNLTKTINSSTCIDQINLLGITYGKLYIQDRSGNELVLPTPAKHVITKVAMSGDRIGIVSSYGAALVKEGGLHAPWVTVNNFAKDLVLDGDRIGVLTHDKKALVKEGSLHASWVTVATNVRHLALSSSSLRIGIINTSYKAYVKQGRLNEKWVHVSNDTERLALDRYRIGIITKSNKAYVKDGALNAKWFKISDQSKRISLSGNRIGVIGTKNNAWVKEGRMTAKWVQISHSGKSSEIHLGSNIIGIRTLGKKDMFYKKGGLSTPWRTPKIAKGFSYMAVK